MSSHSPPQFAVPRDSAASSRSERLSRPTNSPTGGPTLEVLPSNASHDTLVAESEPDGDASITYHETNTELTVDQVSLPRISTYKALGVLSIFALAGGTIVVLAALSFLLFLWYGKGSGTGGEHATSAWRKIMLRDSLPQIITLASLAMRVTIAAQTTLCTSMYAALILERRKVRKSQAAQFSIARSVNDGPWRLIFTLVQDVPSQVFLRPESILMVILGLAALGTQFTSTILLSDLGEASLTQFPSTRLLNLTTTPDTSIGVNTPYWAQRPRAFPSFGESPPGYFADPNEHGLSDTGLKRRALLPFSDVESRTALRSYEGQAFVLSSRVSCMAPVFSDLQFMTGDFSGTSDYGLIYGNLQYEETFAKAGISSATRCHSERCLPSAFTCNIFSISREVVQGYAADSFCFPNTIPMQAPSASYWNLDDDPWGPDASTILVTTSDVYVSFWNESRAQNIPTPNYTINGEWANFELHPSYFVNISLCFMGLNVMFSEVNLTSTADEVTDAVEKQPMMFGPVINTTDIQVLLGADPSIQGFTERDVFEIERIKDDPDHVFIAQGNQTLSLAQNSTSVLESYLINIAQGQTANSTISMCDPCTGYSTQGSSPLYVNIFSYILRRTNRAAVALQSVYTVLGQTVYYDLLEKYDEPYDTHVVSSKTIRIPKRSLGLVAVMALVVSSVVSVGAMTALFGKHSRYTLLGESWHTLSQVVGDEMEVVLNEKMILADDAIATDIEGEDSYVKLGRSSTSGRVEVVRCDVKD
ncbi:hypothetical protein F5X98DRAFT_381578 [Xylaria grammica]|nr:hypothetical protein F5X98DRAFT_381578 [Xylaria grammica]